jgi:DUF971 family protein
MIKINAPIGLFRKGTDTLKIDWNDNTSTEYNVLSLRSSCPCAVCVNEWTGEKMLNEATLAKDVHPMRLVSVGRYAVAIHWSDGHKTGIYSYDYLKKLGVTTPEGTVV